MVAARDRSPAAKAGLRTGDYVRAIDNQPTRELSVWEGMRALRGAPGSTVKLTIIRGNAADPHELQLTREALSPSDVTGRIATPGVGYIRIAAIGPKTADQVKKEVGDLTKSGATKLVVDVRRTAGGRSTTGWRSRGCSSARARSPCAKRRARNGRRSPRRAATARVTAPGGAAHRHRHLRRGGAVCRGAFRQSARRSDRRTHDRTGRHAEAHQAARRQRSVAVDHALPHAERRTAARKRPRPHGRGRRAGRRVRSAGADDRRGARKGDRTPCAESGRVAHKVPFLF